MTDAIQGLVEGLGQHLQRSVAVDDPNLRLVSCSSHYDDADPARLGSLTGRQVTGPILEYAVSCGATTWRGLERLPANPALGLNYDRLCFPLRSRYELLGFMWVTDAKEAGLTEAEVEVATTTAEQLKSILAQRAQSAIETVAETENLVLNLLSPSKEDQRHSAEKLKGTGFFHLAGSFTAIVVSLTNDRANNGFGESAIDLVRRAHSYATRTLFSKSYAYAISNTESCLIVGYRKTPSISEIQRLAGALFKEVERADPSLAQSITVGIGEEYGELEEVVGSFHQAVGATRVGRTHGKSIVSWADNPLESLLSTLLVHEYNRTMISDILWRVEANQSAEIRSMIEAYLDNAGNVPATAEQLNVHRTTIYYRIRRFQEVTGLDLDDGLTRLLLHLWFKSKAYASPI